jgi:proline dehydrogenase
LREKLAQREAEATAAAIAELAEQEAEAKAEAAAEQLPLVAQATAEPEVIEYQQVFVVSKAMASKALLLMKWGHQLKARRAAQAILLISKITAEETW